jgi:hypothetical protein
VEARGVPSLVGGGVSIGRAVGPSAHPISSVSSADRKPTCAPQRRGCAVMASQVTPVGGEKWVLPDRSVMVTSITATTVESFLAEMDEAAATTVDLLELRLDFITDYDTERDLRRIMKHAKLPYIVTYRPTWEASPPKCAMQAHAPMHQSTCPDCVSLHIAHTRLRCIV